MQTTSLFGNISTCPFISTIIIGNNNKKGQVRATPNRYEASPGSNAKWLRCCQCAPRGRDTGRWRQVLCLDDKRCNSCFLSRTHLPLPFLFSRRRNSQEAGKGVLLLKCLCQGEEEDERGRGISWALAAQDSPSFSLHHIEMEMSLHPQLRNAHQGGEMGEEKPKWVLSLQRKAAPPPGAEEKASSLGIRGSKRWPRLARRQGRMASELARRQPGVQERPPGGDRPHGAPRRGAPRSASPAPVTSAPSPLGQSPPPPRSRWGLKIKTPTAGSKWRRRLGERGGKRRGAARTAPSVPRHSPAPGSSRAVPAGRARALGTTRQARGSAAAVHYCGSPAGGSALRPSPSSWSLMASTGHTPLLLAPPAGRPAPHAATIALLPALRSAPLRYASPRLTPAPPLPPPPPPGAWRSPPPPRHWPHCAASASHWLLPRVNHLLAKGAILAQRSEGGTEGRRSSQALFPRPQLNPFFWLVAAPEEAGLLLRRSYRVGECGRLSARKRPAIGGDAS